MLEARNLRFGYGLRIGNSDNGFEIRDVSMKIEPGYVTCLLGKNGSGKTTLLSLLYGMLMPKSGEVLWNKEALNWNNLFSFRQEVAYFGEKFQAENLTVAENAKMLSTLYPTFDKGYYEELIRMADLREAEEKVFSTLSTGERVKADITFLMARRPKLILLDEPLANVDPVFKVDVLELLQRAVSESETGVLISTHLVDEISDVVDYVAVLEKGSLVESGTRFDVLGDGQLRDVFAR